MNSSFTFSRTLNEIKADLDTENIPSSLAVEQNLRVLHDCCFTKIFINYANKNRYTGVENVISHQANRVEKTGSRNA